jgi:FlaG/FlaF family flagellin (archaellin)
MTTNIHTLYDVLIALAVIVAIAVALSIATAAAAAVHRRGKTQAAKPPAATAEPVSQTHDQRDLTIR